MRVLLLATAFSLFLSSPSSAQEISAEYRADVEQLLVLMNAQATTKELVESIKEPLLNNMRQQYPNMPPRAATLTGELLVTEFGKMYAGPDSLVPELVLIYSRHYTAADVKGMIAFYSSELGQKMAAASPALAREASMAGQQWVMARLPDMMKRLTERFIAEGIIQ